MDKKLKLSFISLIVLSCVMVAWATLASFFKGGGIALVATMLMLAYLTYCFATDSYVRSRIKDLFFIAIILSALELIIFIITLIAGFAGALKVIEVMSVIQLILSIVWFAFFVYIVFRLIYETNNQRFSVVEKMLGNNTQQTKRVKQSKEFTNGSLEEKPNKQRKEGTFYNTVSSDTDQEGEE